MKIWNWIFSLSGIFTATFLIIGINVVSLSIQPTSFISGLNLIVVITGLFRLTLEIKNPLRWWAPFYGKKIYFKEFINLGGRPSWFHDFELAEQMKKIIEWLKEQKIAYAILRDPGDLDEFNLTYIRFLKESDAILFKLTWVGETDDIGDPF